MIWRLTSRSLAGTCRTLVAVGTAKLATMLATIVAPAPRMGSPVPSVDDGVVAGFVAAATDGAVVGAAGVAGAGGCVATGATAGAGSGSVTLAAEGGCVVAAG